MKKFLSLVFVIGCTFSIQSKIGEELPTHQTSFIQQLLNPVATNPDDTFTEETIEIPGAVTSDNQVWGMTAITYPDGLTKVKRFLVQDQILDTSFGTDGVVSDPIEANYFTVHPDGSFALTHFGGSKKENFYNITDSFDKNGDFIQSQSAIHTSGKDY